MQAKLFTDGGARGNPGPAGLGAALYDINDKLISINAEYGGEITNNQAEYLALIMGVKLAIKEGIKELDVFMDSELVVKQIKGEYRIKDEKMQSLKLELDKQLKKLQSVSFTHVKRDKNKIADKLVNIVLDSK
ncbi:ribonuclease HI family protein [Candidatus Dojkabacteria bacterium]|uniref:Ribonuclease HI family protein n=1 Tax=Candidatus Dojkabacteria bacterium TaxID=2099670 RepID=A0A955RJ59_9BACT|nr:ribonuclease HI family protein [Candidatus Dojkabacteria bacterium]